MGLTHVVETHYCFTFLIVVETHIGMRLLKENLICFLIPLGLILINCSKSDDPRLQGSGVFQSTVDNGIIEGELFLPEGEGPFPVIIIVPGSGLGPRAESEPFADLFNPVGHAVYIYDKRGIGGSTGSYPPEDADGTEFFNRASGRHTCHN